MNTYDVTVRIDDDRSGTERRAVLTIEAEDEAHARER
jgi:hypothetical protein